MKKFTVLIVSALIACGAVCMSYSSFWAFDVIGFMLMSVGGVIGTIKTLRLGKASKRLKIVLLCLLYLAIVLFTIAGAVLFSCNQSN